MKRLLFLILTFISSSAFCQNTSINIGKKDSVYSTILKEKRNLSIYLPENFDANKKYPVVYLLDGKTNFHSFTGIINHLSNTDVIPEMIVVGI